MTHSPLRPIAAILILAAVAPLGARAELAWREPDPAHGAIVAELPQPPAGDPCDCLGGLRACLIDASVAVTECPGRPPAPTRPPRCDLELRLEVLACLERSAACRLACGP